MEASTALDERWIPVTLFCALRRAGQPQSATPPSDWRQYIVAALWNQGTAAARNPLWHKAKSDSWWPEPEPAQSHFKARPLSGDAVLRRSGMMSNLAGPVNRNPPNRLKSFKIQAGDRVEFRSRRANLKGGSPEPAAGQASKPKG